MNENEYGHADRRATERFPIERDIRYHVLNARGKHPATTGNGRTINMSSGGVLFNAGDVLPPGKVLEVSVSWPAQLNAKCGLRLVARGPVVRFESGKAAMRIQQYEFRTQGLAAAPQP